jgi:hypothetical protein
MRACRNSPSRGCRRPSEVRLGLVHHARGSGPRFHAQLHIDMLQVLLTVRGRMPSMSAISRSVLPFASHDRTSAFSAVSPNRAVAVTIKHSPAESIARRASATPRFTRTQCVSKTTNANTKAARTRTIFKTHACKSSYISSTLTDSTAAGREHCTPRCRSVTTSRGGALALRESVRQVPRASLPDVLIGSGNPPRVPHARAHRA